MFIKSRDIHKHIWNVFGNGKYKIQRIVKSHVNYLRLTVSSFITEENLTEASLKLGCALNIKRLKKIELKYNLERKMKIKNQFGRKQVRFEGNIAVISLNINRI